MQELLDPTADLDQLIHSDDVVSRKFLTNRLDALENETPEFIFNTKDSYQAMILNRSGSEIKAGLFHGWMFCFPIPGLVESMEYQGLKIWFPRIPFAYTAQLGNGAWTGVGQTTQQGTPVEKMEYGFEIFGKHAVLYPLGNGEDALLVDRVSRSFTKFRKFEYNRSRNFRFMKNPYNFFQYIRYQIAKQCGKQNESAIPLLSLEQIEKTSGL